MLESTIDVLWTARYDYQSGSGLEFHEHSYFQMIHFLNGRGTLRLGDADHPIRPGLLFLIKPHQIHGLRAMSVIKTLDIKFVVKNAKLRRELLAAPNFSRPDAAIPALFERIRFEGERRVPHFRDMCRNLMCEIVLYYLRRQPGREENHAAMPAQAQDPFLRKIIEYVGRNYSRPMDIGDIAHALGCSDRFLRMRFRDLLGIRPLQYLQRHRIGRAKELIEYSDYSLKEIAGMVGFKSVHHFTRLFTAAERMSPAAWRRKYHEGIRKDVCINPRFSNQNRVFTSTSVPDKQPSGSIK